MGSGHETPSQLLRRLGIRPKKRLGQSFLTSASICRAIVRAADISTDDIVVEVGPGLGILTQSLAEAGATVIAVELDSLLASFLREKFINYPKVHIVQADILDVAPGELLEIAAAKPPYKLVANIPYYITSAVLRHFLAREPRPSLIVLMMQKEVAQRLAASPPNMNLLALSVQLFGTPEIVMEIGPGAFYPPPKVKSAVVRIALPTSPPFPPSDYSLLFAIARACFQQARKQAAGTLSKTFGIDRILIENILVELGLSPKVRPQEISTKLWLELAERIRPLLSEPGPTPN
jgi:16S rRNA (adenine1518-N6/adenine1519-N6)-dimethyltransferase